MAKKIEKVEKERGVNLERVIAKEMGYYGGRLIEAGQKFVLDTADCSEDEDGNTVYPLWVQDPNADEEEIEGLDLDDEDGEVGPIKGKAARAKAPAKKSAKKVVASRAKTPAKKSSASPVGSTRDSGDDVDSIV